MQWDRALSALRRLERDGTDLSRLASVDEAMAAERLRALTGFNLGQRLAAYRLLTAICTGNEDYADRLVEQVEAIQTRRDVLLAGLGGPTDGSEPGTTWISHPYHPRFDDVRRPIWLYLGWRADAAPRLRLARAGSAAPGSPSGDST